MKINKTIKAFIFADFLLQLGWGFIGPIFAVFVTQHITGGSLTLVGLLSAVYWITKSTFQPFIAHSLDVVKGEKDDFDFLVRGMLVANLVPLGYFFATHIWQIFVLEFIRGIAMACVFPSWMAIFTRHINKGWEAFSWSVQSTSVGFAAGFAAALGGFLATFFGFKAVFILVSVFGLLSSLLLILVRKRIFSKNNDQPSVS